MEIKITIDLEYWLFKVRLMKNIKSKKQIRRLRTAEDKYEEMQKEEKKRIQKDKSIGEEEDEEKEQEEENGYIKGKDEEKDYNYKEEEMRKR